MIFIGIDQTGAVDLKGKPRKLPVARLDKNHIEVFKISNLKELDLKNVKIIAIDSVLGLPNSVFPKNKLIRDLFSEAKKFKHENKEFGMETAYQFFQKQLKKQNQYPKRFCEELAQANSVFQKHPFQKNIGCGTFRIWKELGEDSKWFHLWPHDGQYHSLKSKPIIVEGYPSLVWRTLLNSPVRKTETLIQYLAKNKLKMNTNKIDNDTADAVVLALAAQKFHQKPQKIEFKNYQQEGWIMGLSNPN